MDTDLYSMGAFFCDQHPELVDEVVARSEAIEQRGLERWADETGTPVEEAFRTLAHRPRGPVLQGPRRVSEPKARRRPRPIGVAIIVVIALIVLA